MQRKILVALDGSIHDTYTRRYIHTIFKNQPDIMFTLATILPGRNLSESKQLLDGGEIKEPQDATSLKKKTQSQKHHDAIIQKLTTQGFSHDQFESSIVFSPTAPAIKLYNIGQLGLYDALLLARRGIDRLTSFLTGSTSQTILNKNNTMPVWVLNGAPANANFLIPVDCSRHCMAGVDHLAFILHDNPNAIITLFHATTFFTKDPEVNESVCYHKWGKEWQEQAKSTDKTCHYHFFAAQMILKEAGFPVSRTKTISSKMDIEPARAIVNYSNKHNFHNIVIGRRPKSDLGFFKGISDRLLNHTTDTALWIVG